MDLSFTGRVVHLLYEIEVLRQTNVYLGCIISLSTILYNLIIYKDESSVKRPLFSRKEIVHLVRKFILAYIRGEITFDLVIKPETYKRRFEMDGTPIGEAHVYDETQKLFFQIPNTMLKCAGLIETNVL